MAETARDVATRSNVTADYIAKSERDFVESLEKLETAKGKHRSLIKRLKADGINVEILKTVVGLKRQDPEDVLGNQKDFIRYARVLALPVGAQLTLLSDDDSDDDDQLSEQARIDQEAWDCGQMGMNAGKNGEPASNNPYPPGQLNHAAWAEGQKRGEELRGVVAKRGRPKKVTDTPEGSA